MGVIPIPPATRATLGRRRTASVKTPNGPSATTRVPGRIVPTRWLKSPRSFTVMRRESSVGAAERDPRVRAQVHEVPQLVAEALACDHDGTRHDEHEQGRADRRGDHPGIAGEERPDLAADGEPVERRVAERDEQRVRDDEVETSM